jgi:drug/metabolite transporter (DMT)-like permease
LSDRKALYTLVGIHLLWAAVNKFIQMAGTMMSPLAIAACRWALVSALLFVLLQTQWFRKLTFAKWPSRPQALQATLLGAVLFGPSHALYCWAVANKESPCTPVAGTVLLCTAPLFAAILGYFVLAERPTRNQLLAVPLGLIGAYVTMFGFRYPTVDGSGVWGSLAFFTAVVIEGIAMAYLTGIARKSSGIATLAFQTLGAGISLWVVALVMPGKLPISFGPFSWQGVVGFSYLVIVSSLICFPIWYRLAESGRQLGFLALALLLQPPLAGVIDYFSGEKLGANLFLGMAIVMIALFVGSRKPSIAREPAFEPA